MSGDCESPSHHRTAKGGASTSTITESQQDSSSSSSGTCPISMVSTYRYHTQCIFIPHTVYRILHAPRVCGGRLPMMMMNIRG